jgi:hypothetical protein
MSAGLDHGTSIATNRSVRTTCDSVVRTERYGVDL